MQVNGWTSANAIRVSAISVHLFEMLAGCRQTTWALQMLRLSGDFVCIYDAAGALHMLCLSEDFGYI